MTNIKTEMNPARMKTPPGCTITFSGKVVDLFNPDPETIYLEDIAHSLSHICRWGGHTKSFYSVAEHCIRVSLRVPKGKKLTALFHDCEEAYWGDLIRPLKMLLPVETVTKIVAFRQVVFDKFGVLPIDEEINEADNNEIDWDYENVVTSCKHYGMKPLDAKEMWLNWTKKLLKL